jgi:hypothetical protein
MSDLAKELGAGTLTSEQVDAITHALLDLTAMRDLPSCADPWSRELIMAELSAAAKDSVSELESAFPGVWER